jgi:hypothetical protein
MPLIPLHFPGEIRANRISERAVKGEMEWIEEDHRCIESEEDSGNPVDSVLIRSNISTIKTTGGCEDL